MIHENTYLLFLLIEVINDDANKQIQGEERPEDYEDDEVKVHVKVIFILGLLVYLQDKKCSTIHINKKVA